MESLITRYKEACSLADDPQYAQRFAELQADLDKLLLSAHPHQVEFLYWSHSTAILHAAAVHTSITPKAAPARRLSNPRR